MLEPIAAPARNQTTLLVLSIALLCTLQGILDFMGSEITVFRSADEDARDDSAEIVRMLGEAGIPATLLDDNAPGVPAGAYEIRVAEENRARAEEVVASFTSDEQAESEA